DLALVLGGELAGGESALAAGRLGRTPHYLALALLGDQRFGRLRHARDVLAVVRRAVARAGGIDGGLRGAPLGLTLRGDLALRMRAGGEAERHREPAHRREPDPGSPSPSR